MIQLGDKVKDTVSGATGIAIARTEWMHGCVRIFVQAQETKDGKPAETFSVDEPQLVVVENAAVPNDPFWREPKAEATRRVAGPRPEVSRAPDPSR